MREQVGGGLGGLPDRMPDGVPVVELRQHLAVLGVLLAEGELHGPVRRRVVVDLGFHALRLGRARGADGAGQALVVGVGQLPDLLGGGLHGGLGVGIEVGAEAGGARVRAHVDQADRARPVAEERLVDVVREAGDRGAGRGALALVGGVKPRHAGEELVLEQ